MDSNNLQNIHPDHPSYASNSRQNLDPEHQYEPSPEISPYDGGNGGIQSPAPSSFPDGHNALSVDESGEVLDMSHPLRVMVPVSISPAPPSLRTSNFTQGANGSSPSFPQNLEAYDQSIYQGNRYDARKSEHSIQRLPGIQSNGDFFDSGSSVVHDSQQYLALLNAQRMFDQLYTYEELAIIAPIADQQPPMDLSSPPLDIGSFAATLSHSDDSRAFLRLPGYHKKKNDL